MNFNWTDEKVIEFINFLQEIKSDLDLNSSLKEFKSNDNFFKTIHTYRPLPDYLSIEDSEIDNKGLFTKEELFRNTVLGISHVIVKGELFENDLIRTPLGGFINHSENANTEMIKIGDIYCLSTLFYINAGEELTINYKKTPCINKNKCLK